MRNLHQESPNRSAPMLIAGICLALSLTGCIHPNPPLSSGGGSTPGGGTTCANLPASLTTYKGGDTLGEELTLSIDPATLAYTITIDASEQRTAGTQASSGTLTQLTGCQYSSDEAGAVFTIGAGGASGAVQGGVKTVDGASFVPLIAFGTTYNNAGAPTVFNDAALIFNDAGVQTTAGTAASYGGSGRIRNAGTVQFCIDAANGGFAAYDTNCSNTTKGYLVYNSDSGRGAFDFFATDPAGKAVTTGGTLAGSMVIGLVNGVEVPLFLLRASATDFGMHLLTLQGTTPASGSDADGSYAVVDSSGVNANATIAGSTFTHSADTATLAYDTPTNGVVEATGTPAGHLIYAGGIYGFVPSGTGGALFELGLQE